MDAGMRLLPISESGSGSFDPRFESNFDSLGCTVVVYCSTFACLRPTLQATEYSQQASHSSAMCHSTSPIATVTT